MTGFIRALSRFVLIGCPCGAVLLSGVAVLLLAAPSVLCTLLQILAATVCLIAAICLLTAVVRLLYS